MGIFTWATTAKEGIPEFVKFSFFHFLSSNIDRRFDDARWQNTIQVLS